MRAVAVIIEGMISPVIGQTDAVDVVAIAAKVAELQPDLTPSVLQDAVALAAMSLGLSCFWSGRTPIDGARQDQRLDESIAA